MCCKFLSKPLLPQTCFRAFFYFGIKNSSRIIERCTTRFSNVEGKMDRKTVRRKEMLKREKRKKKNTYSSSNILRKSGIVKERQRQKEKER
jgi:hypothetical protein